MKSLLHQVISIVMIFLSWNIRGINNPLKDSTIKSEIIKNKAEVVGLTETRLSVCSQSKVSALWGNRSVNFEVANVVSNNSGGLLLMWNPDYFQASRCIKGARWMIIIGCMVPMQ